MISTTKKYHQSLRMLHRFKLLRTIIHSRTSIFTSPGHSRLWPTESGFSYLMTQVYSFKWNTCITFIHLPSITQMGKVNTLLRKVSIQKTNKQHKLNWSTKTIDYILNLIFAITVNKLIKILESSHSISIKWNIKSKWENNTKISIGIKFNFLFWSNEQEISKWIINKCIRSSLKSRTSFLKLQKGIKKKQNVVNALRTNNIHR